MNRNQEYHIKCTFCKLVTLCNAEATTRQRATSGLHLLPNSYSCSNSYLLSERHQVPNLMSLVRPGCEFEPTTLRMGSEHSTTKAMSLEVSLKKIST